MWVRVAVGVGQRLRQCGSGLGSVWVRVGSVSPACRRCPRPHHIRCVLGKREDVGCVCVCVCVCLCVCACVLYVCVCVCVCFVCVCMCVSVCVHVCERVCVLWACV